MKKWIRVLGVVLIVGLLSGLSFSVVVFGQDVVSISPETLNLVQFGGEEVTVHISIAYPQDTIVIVQMVSYLGTSYLGTIEASSTFADDRGDLVAKFNLDDVERIVEEGENILTLYVNDEKKGSDTIQVIYGAMKNGK